MAYRMTRSTTYNGRVIVAAYAQRMTEEKCNDDTCVCLMVVHQHFVVISSSGMSRFNTSLLHVSLNEASLQYSSTVLSLGLLFCCPCSILSHYNISLGATRSPQPRSPSPPFNLLKHMCLHL